MKDLPDIALLATARALDGKRLGQALAQTFAHRKTHALPPSLPDPPLTWAVPYSAMARENKLPWVELSEVARAAQSFLDPVLQGVDATWEFEQWLWRPNKTN